MGRRHKLKLGYTKLDRDRADYTLQRDFTWGGETYDAGLSASTSTGSDILGGYYRFALFRNDRFEIGPTIGVGYLWLNARIQATGTVSGPGGSQSRSLDERASTGSITGAVGGFAQAWPAKRLTVYADYLYIKVTPEDSEASVTDWRAGANYYFGATSAWARSTSTTSTATTAGSWSASWAARSRTRASSCSRRSFSSPRR